MSVSVVKNATCTFCGCVCDDIELHAEGDRIIKAKNACSLGESWFRNHTAERLYPDALIDGKPATVDAAVEAAADFLYRAHMPLVYGLSNITCEAQREASPWPADRRRDDSHTRSDTVHGDRRPVGR
jgi:formylmethanofuran dehydrogenase subunit B